MFDEEEEEWEIAKRRGSKKEKNGDRGQKTRHTKSKDNVGKNKQLHSHDEQENKTAKSLW